jgi:hypothetical protein
VPCSTLHSIHSKLPHPKVQHLQRLCMALSMVCAPVYNSKAATLSQVAVVTKVGYVLLHLLMC